MDSIIPAVTASRSAEVEPEKVIFAPYPLVAAILGAWEMDGITMYAGMEFT